MIEIVRYSPIYKQEWDNLVSRSKNGTFLFLRDYMDYHADRFEDYSFLFKKGGKVEAVLPGNISGKSFFTHQGLTYGGLVMSENLSTCDSLEIFSLLTSELQRVSFSEIIYKPVPYIYHSIPSEEDLYSLFILGAKKIGCNISSVIFLDHKLGFKELRRRGVKKSKKEGLKVVESLDIQKFWEILSHNLKTKYGEKPVHSIDEINLLMNRFPNNIKLYLVEKGAEVVAGTLLYLNKNTIHAQYIGSNETGKELGAIDFLFNEIINHIFTGHKIFDFGISTENNGIKLNKGLAFQKEGFGGRGVVYDIYKILL